MRADNILQTIGDTPVIHINRLFGSNTNVWIKSERSNPGGSIKDRIALSMVEDAENPARSSPAASSSSPPAATPAWAWPWSRPSRATS
jgi:cysteine synthase A